MGIKVGKQKYKKRNGDEIKAVGKKKYKMVEMK